MRDNSQKNERRKKGIRRKLRELDRRKKGLGESPADRRDEKRKKIREIKENKLDFDLVKKFKNNQLKKRTRKQKLKELHLTRGVTPYGLKKDYIEETANTQMINDYDSIKKVTSRIREVITPYAPKLKDLDYKRGYIKRYFVQRANDNRAPISEVSKIKFSQVAANPFYKQIKLKWRITGEIKDVEDISGNIKKGVHTSNKRSIEEHLGKMPSLKNRLVNLAEYHEKFLSSKKIK
tara:strand:- start:76 stop:780 length:705 start_codon:yes stop_codon:yes gene_type:complete